MLFLFPLLVPSILAKEPEVVLLTGGYSNSGMLASSEAIASHLCPAPPLPAARMRHLAAVTADGLLLVCGGTLGGNQYATSCLALDPATGTWAAHSEMVGSRVYSAAVTLAGGVYVLGGAGSARFSSELLATGATRWLAGPGVPGEGLEDACALPTSDTTFLAIGGFWSLQQVLEFDTTKDTWAEWPAMEQGRYGHRCAVTGNSAVVTGGADQRDDYLASTTVINLLTKTVTTAGSMATERFSHGLAMIDGRLLAFGGFDQQYTCLQEVEEWEEGSETWGAWGAGLATGRAEFGVTTLPRSAVCPTNP